jgi:curved DNA-binding protein CbpA
MNMDPNPKFQAEVQALASMIDELDYYHILRLGTNATMGQIRQAYHHQSRIFHPDRYFHLPASSFKQSVYKISKRVTEAYVTLRDMGRRRHYDQQLQQSRGTQLRYTQQSEQAQKKARVEEIGKTEKGRQLYQQGQREMKSRNYVAAERTFKIAMAFEPDNELFKKLAAEAGSKIKVDFKIK